MDVEQVLAEVARKHSVVLSKEDPILMLITIQNMLLQEMQTTQKQAVIDFKSSLEKNLQDWSDRSKLQAEKVMNASIIAAKNAVATGAASGIADGSHALSQAVETVSKRLEKHAQEITSITRRQTHITLATGAAFLVLALIFIFIR